MAGKANAAKVILGIQDNGKWRSRDRYAQTPNAKRADPARISPLF